MNDPVSTVLLQERVGHEQAQKSLEGCCCARRAPFGPSSAKPCAAWAYPIQFAMVARGPKKPMPLQQIFPADHAPLPC